MSAVSVATLTEAERATTRVVVVCSDMLYAHGAQLLLESARVSPVFAVDRIDRATRMCSADPNERPEAVLWIVDRFDMHALTAVRGFRSTRPRTGLCVLATEVDACQLRHLARARAGYLAVVLRQSHTDVREIREALVRASRGAAVLDPRLVERMLVTSMPENRLANLTPIEYTILEHLASGLRNSEIARLMRRSEKAVEKHVSHIFTKLGLDIAERRVDRRVSAARVFHQAQPPPPLGRVSAASVSATLPAGGSAPYRAEPRGSRRNGFESFTHLDGR